MKVAAIIAAAGAGSRMGQNKALCTLGDGRSFLEHWTEKLSEFVPLASITAVVGCDADKVIDQHRALGIRFIENSDWENNDMVDSYRIGARHFLDFDYVWLCSVDGVGVSQEALRAIWNERNEGGVQPFSCCSNGHPILLGQNGIRSFIEFSDTMNLREFLRSGLVTLKRVMTDASVLLNYNTMDDLPDCAALKD